MIRTLLSLILLPSMGVAAVRQVNMQGELFQEIGSFFSIVPGTPFTMTVQLDTEAGAYDWDPTSPHVGLYHFPSAPLSLDFGGYQFRSEGVWLQIWSGLGGANWGFIFWSDAAFSAEGFDVAPNGIYMQYLTADPSVAPDDTLASFKPYDVSTVIAPFERFYMISHGFSSGAPDRTRLLSLPASEHLGFTITDVPEPTGTALLAGGAVMALLSGRRRRA